MINYQTETQKLDDLVKSLNILKGNVLERQENKMLEGHPPMWSTDISDLENFSKELQEWLDEPKLKEVKDIIIKLQGLCGDKRNFQFDDNKSYFISISDIVISGKNVLEDINYDDIKKEGVRALLDHVFQQNNEADLEIEVGDIEEFWQEFTDNIINFDTENDDFIEKVKSDSSQYLIESLKTGFNIDKISDEIQKIKKAKSSRELLKEVDSNVFLSEYNKLKDIDNIWNICDEIRKKIDTIDIDIVDIPEDTHRQIFIDLLNHIQSGKDALNESNLSKIKEKIDGTSKQLISWCEKTNGFIEDDVKRLDSWSHAIEITMNNQEKVLDINIKISELKRKFNSLRFDSINDLKSKELYDIFEEYYRITRDVEDFFKSLLSDEARKILDNLSKLDRIKDDLGDNFWTGIKELSDKFPQIKIKMDWRGV